MTQKIVIRVEMSCEKCRSKAMALVASTSGVNSVAVTGDDKSQLEVLGDGVDSVALTCALRKKVGRARIVLVGQAKEKEKEKGKEPTITYTTYPWYGHHGYQYSPQLVLYEPPPSPANTCSIM